MTPNDLKSWGFDAGAAAHQRLAAFVEALLDENTRHNLTAIRNAPDTWALHVCDSLALAALLRESGAESLVDIGSGGGAPAIPIACVAPDLRIVAIDRIGKKVDAIRRICASIGVHNVEAIHGRAEDLAHQPALREQFDAVTARAVARLPTVLEYAAGFISTGGSGWFYKSQLGAEEEVESARQAEARMNVELVDFHGYALPEPHGERVIVEYRKMARLAAALPRKSGAARKRPL